MIGSHLTFYGGLAEALSCLTLAAILGSRQEFPVYHVYLYPKRS
jgi:hypothetical protein